MANEARSSHRSPPDNVSSNESLDETITLYYHGFPPSSDGQVRLEYSPKVLQDGQQKQSAMAKIERQMQTAEAAADKAVEAAEEAQQQDHTATEADALAAADKAAKAAEEALQCLQTAKEAASRATELAEIADSEKARTAAKEALSHQGRAAVAAADAQSAADEAGAKAEQKGKAIAEADSQSKAAGTAADQAVDLEREARQQLQVVLDANITTEAKDAADKIIKAAEKAQQCLQTATEAASKAVESASIATSRRAEASAEEAQRQQRRAAEAAADTQSAADEAVAKAEQVENEERATTEIEEKSYRVKRAADNASRAAEDAEKQREIAYKTPSIEEARAATEKIKEFEAKVKQQSKIAVEAASEISTTADGTETTEIAAIVESVKQHKDRAEQARTSAARALEDASSIVQEKKQTVIDAEKQLDAARVAAERAEAFATEAKQKPIAANTAATVINARVIADRAEFLAEQANQQLSIVVQAATAVEKTAKTTESPEMIVALETAKRHQERATQAAASALKAAEGTIQQVKDKEEAQKTWEKQRDNARDAADKAERCAIEAEQWKTTIDEVTTEEEVQLAVKSVERAMFDAKRQYLLVTQAVAAVADAVTDIDSNTVLVTADETKQYQDRAATAVVTTEQAFEAVTILAQQWKPRGSSVFKQPISTLVTDKKPQWGIFQKGVGILIALGLIGLVVIFREGITPLLPIKAVIPADEPPAEVAIATEISTPSPTNIPILSTSTPTDTPTPTSTNTPMPTATPTSTPTDTPTSTDTPTPTSTDTPMPTATPTSTPTDTPTPTPTGTPAPTINKAANFRSGPGTHFELVGTGKVGQRVTIKGLSRDGQWYLLGNGYWAFRGLVDNAPKNLPVVETPAPLPTCPDERAIITSPRANQAVSGLVGIMGTAKHHAFDYYKIEYAIGSSQNFVFLRRDTIQITNGRLGSFDSTELPNGEYRIRVVVVDQEGNFPTPCEVPIKIQN